MTVYRSANAGDPDKKQRIETNTVVRIRRNITDPPYDEQPKLCLIVYHPRSFVSNVRREQASGANEWIKVGSRAMDHKRCYTFVQYGTALHPSSHIYWGICGALVRISTRSQCNEMKISFIIPAYNEERNITECIASIQKEVLRTGCDAEVIVVDNNSTDATKAKALACDRVIVVEEARKGIVWARQAGYEASSGDLIANIDADNRLPRGWLDEIFKTFTDPEVVAVSGPLIYHDLPFYERAFAVLFLCIGYAVNTLNSFFGASSMLQGGNYVLRRETLEKMSGYDTSFVFYGEDTDTGRRASQFGKVVWTFKLPIYSSGRRIRKEGLLRTGILYALNFFSVTYAKKPVTKKYSDIRS